MTTISTDNILEEEEHTETVSSDSACTDSIPAEDDETYFPFEGKNGAHFSWKLADDGTLTIIGKGRIPDFSCGSNPVPPWQDQKSRIHTLVIEEGISEIGIKAFEQCEELESVFLPESLYRIHSDCFRGCARLGTFDTKKPRTFRHVLEFDEHTNPLYRSRKSSDPRPLVLGLHSMTGTPWALEQWGEFYISDGVLLDCLAIAESFVIPRHVRKIGRMSFSGLPVSSVIFCDGLEEIQEYAFRKTALKELKFPAGIKKIARGAFCHSPLSYAEFSAETRPDFRMDKEAFIDTLVVFPSGKSNALSALYQVGTCSEKGISPCRRLTCQRNSSTAGMNVLDAGTSLLQKIQRGSIVAGIILEPDTKLVKEVRSYAWNSAQKALIAYRLQPCPGSEEDGSAEIWSDSTEDLGTREFVSEFFTAEPAEHIPEGNIRVPFPNTGEEWYCTGHKENFQGPLELELLNQWLKKHPEYQIHSRENLQ